MRLISFAFLVLALGCSRDRSPENGVYVSPKKVYIFHSEILELRDGRYRYWMLGDVGSSDPIEMSGRYIRKGDKIIMSGDYEMPFDRFLLQDDDMGRLLRYDAVNLWMKEKKLYPYGTLTRVPYTFEEMRPSIEFGRKEWEILVSKLPTLTENIK